MVQSFSDDIRMAHLVCFCNKNGDETHSPYKAELWKRAGVRVYAKLCSGLNNEFEGMVSKIGFRYRKSPIITVRTRHGAVKYQLDNVRCNTQVLHYKKLYFFDDDRKVEIPTSTSARASIFTPVNAEGSCEMLKKHRKAGKMVSIYYEDHPHLENKLLGIFRDVVDYDEKNQMLTTSKTKVFLLGNPA